MDIISHSMGVTMARRVIKGGHVEGAKVPYDVGAPLNDRVNTLIGIAGANWGAVLC